MVYLMHAGLEPGIGSASSYGVRVDCGLKSQKKSAMVISEAMKANNVPEGISNLRKIKHMFLKPSAAAYAAEMALRGLLQGSPSTYYLLCILLHPLSIINHGAVMLVKRKMQEIENARIIFVMVNTYTTLEIYK